MTKKATGKRVKQADGTVKVHGKEANGAGSIYFDKSKRCYRASYTDPATGRRRTVSGRTKGEVEQRRADKLAALAAATPTGRLGDAPTVADLVTWWVDNVAAVTVRPSTLHTYRKDCGRITEHLGTLPLVELDREAVRSFLGALRRDGLAASTTRNARTRLRQVAEQAVELGYLSSNPVPGVPTPKATAEERTRRRTLTADETRNLVSVLDGTRPLDAAIGLLFTSGIRVSEALGLAWSDLDLDAGTVTIRRGATYTGGGVGVRLDAPKTEGTAGVHHLAPSVSALLRARRAQQAADRLAAGPAWKAITYEGEPVELVFTTKAGAMVLRQNVTSALHRACERAGIDPTGVATHTGRRSVATALFVAGVPLDDVARHVGHSDPSTTARYVQDLGTRPADTARRAAALLDPAAGDS